MPDNSKYPELNAGMFKVLLLQFQAHWLALAFRWWCQECQERRNITATKIRI